VLGFRYSKCLLYMALRRTKILTLIPSLSGGGAERVFSTLLRHLDRTLFEPHLAVLRGKSAQMYDLPADVVVHEIPAPRARYAVLGIVRVICRTRPEVVLSTLMPMNLVLMLTRPLLPAHIRLFVRDSARPSDIIGRGRFSPLWRWIYHFLYSRADAIICPSHAIAQDAATNFRIPRSKLVHIYNPVDAQYVRQLAAVGPSPYFGPGPQLVAVGRLSREKGFDLLLEAMPAVREKLPAVRLAILGDGYLFRELNHRAKCLGLADIVRFYGFQPNPWPFIKHADIFVLSSRNEGLPNVLLEAMVLGKPIVAADCSGIGELLNFVPTMKLVRPGDPAALAQAIISACESESCHLGSSDGLRVFDVRKIVNEYSQLMLPAEHERKAPRSRQKDD
jgi:glycosyltransferase involved in cell wall biosynthesis